MLFEATYGREGALLIMDFLPQDGRADVATKHDLEMQAELLTQDIHSIRMELGRTTEVLGRGIQSLGHDLRADIAQLEVRLLAALESLRDEVHAEHRTMSWVVNLAVAVAFISLVISIAGLG